MGSHPRHRRSQAPAELSRRHQEPELSLPESRLKMRCWCGNTHLSNFGEGYLRCDACQTLVSERMAGQVDDRVHDDASDLYGRDYWFSHQTKDLNCPDIVTRS